METRKILSKSDKNVSFDWHVKIDRDIAVVKFEPDFMEELQKKSHDSYISPVAVLKRISELEKIAWKDSFSPYKSGKEEVKPDVSGKAQKINLEKFSVEQVLKIMTDNKLEKVADFRNWFNKNVVPQIKLLEANEINHINKVLVEVEARQTPVDNNVKIFI